MLLLGFHLRVIVENNLRRSQLAADLVVANPIPQPIRVTPRPGEKGLGSWRRIGDLGLEYEAPDISRADNKAMAEAAKTIVEAFATMRANGWITDELAIRLAFKFAGEVLSDEQVTEILEVGSNETDESVGSGGTNGSSGRGTGAGYADESNVLDALAAAADAVADGWLD